MSELAVDYSFSRPNITALAQHGVKAIGRYLAPSAPSTLGKILTVREVDAILAAKLDVWTVFEAGAGNALRGAKQGAVDGRVAVQQLHGLGAPDTMAVYFAVDQDTGAAQLPVIGEYLDAARAELGRHSTGIYGEFDVCAYMLNHGHATLAWQTVAWSGGRRLAAAAIYQHAQTVSWGGGSSDIDEIDAVHFGGWRNSQQIPQPRANPFPRPDYTHHILDFRPNQADEVHGAPAQWAQWALAVATDGIVGPVTRAALTHFQLAHHLVVDLRVGPATGPLLAAVHR